MRRALSWIASVAVGATVVGCDAPDTKNCPIVGMNGSDIYELEYSLLIPAHCPVPIGDRGEKKRAGARITDKGTRDFSHAQVEVRNSEGSGLKINFDPFRTTSSGGVAEPTTDYAAATGYSSDLDKAYDYGYFYALRTLKDYEGPYGQVKITYARSAMANVIDGTAIPPRNSSATWRATVAGGVPPFNFYWYRDGVLVGTSEFYTGSTGTENFWLRAAVVDQTMTERVAVMPVDVGGALVQIDGPHEALVYTDSPGISSATWTAVVQGGTAPFTYQWYRDGYPTGNNTSSHTEYVHESGAFTLRVEIRDAMGKTAVDQRSISVAQSCSGCQAY